MSETSSKKRKLSLPLVLAGGVSSLVLALGMSPTFSAFTASIQNTINTAGAGALIMTETDGTTTCNSNDTGVGNTTNTNTLNAASCAQINKYGGNLAMVPGQTSTANITVKNTGTVAASTFSVGFGPCTQSTNGSMSGSAIDFCKKLNIVIKVGTTTIASGTADSIANSTVSILPLLGNTPIAGGSGTTTFVVTAQLDTSAGNAYQGLKASQPITWTYQA